MAPGAGPKESKEGKGGVGPSRTRGSLIYRGEFRQSSEFLCIKEDDEFNNLNNYTANLHPTIVEDMMYAFGDVEKPDADSVALMEDMTMAFLADLCHRARPNPSKIPIPSNQNTINMVANGLLQQQQQQSPQGTIKGDIDELVSSTDSSLSSRSNFRSTTNRAKVNSAAAAPTSSAAAASRNQIATIPPRLAPHPYVAQSRMTVEDLKFACRKDAKLSSRIEELLYLDKVITAAQKAFHPEEDERTAGQ